MTKGLVTVFGGSGFVGTHLVKALVKDGWRVRVPMRRPHVGQSLKVIGNVGQVQLVQANIRFEQSVADAIEGSDAVINLVAVLSEAGKQNFQSLHVRGAETVARLSAGVRIANYVHMSSLGADANGLSEYARTKAAGEALVRDHVPSADIMRPSIIFGPKDKFFNRFAAMALLSPFLPLIGGGKTRFEPVYVGDVAEAIAKSVNQATAGRTYELGGPRTYSFRGLLRFTLDTIDRKRLLVPVPWFVARTLGVVGEMCGGLPLIDPFLTRDQVQSLKTDNIVSEGAKTLDDLAIRRETIEAIVPTYLWRYRRYGRFHEHREEG